MASDHHRGPIRVGTSGWVYQHWRGPFYPATLPARRWLPYYAERFDTVEVNNSFYALPSVETFTNWRASTPEGFTFAIKGSRFITHMKKLKEPQEPIERLFGRIWPLTDKLGPILFQLPPRWRVDVERLGGFLEALPPGYRYTLELRDPSWFDDRVYTLLQEHGIAFCIYDLSHQTSPLVVTSDMVYVRLHGPGDAYRGSYDDATLTRWAERFTIWSAEGRSVWCYFDNDEAGFAAADARRLKETLRG